MRYKEYFTKKNFQNSQFFFSLKVRVRVFRVGLELGLGLGIGFEHFLIRVKEF